MRPRLGLLLVVVISQQRALLDELFDDLQLDFFSGRCDSEVFFGSGQVFEVLLEVLLPLELHLVVGLRVGYPDLHDADLALEVAELVVALVHDLRPCADGFFEVALFALLALVDHLEVVQTLLQLADARHHPVVVVFDVSDQPVLLALLLADQLLQLVDLLVQLFRPAREALQVVFLLDLELLVVVLHPADVADSVVLDLVLRAGVAAAVGAESAVVLAVLEAERPFADVAGFFVLPLVLVVFEVVADLAWVSRCLLSDS